MARDPERSVCARFGRRARAARIDPASAGVRGRRHGAQDLGSRLLPMIPVAIAVVAVAVPRVRWAAVAAVAVGFAALRVRDAGQGQGPRSREDSGEDQRDPVWMWAATLPLVVRVAWADASPTEP